MTWEAEVTKVPTSIGAIFLALTDYDGVPANHIITFNVEVLDQTGRTLTTRTGDLEPHLTQEQKTTIVAFLAEIRAKAEIQLLPQE